jgi:hypothetical protein
MAVQFEARRRYGRQWPPTPPPPRRPGLAGIVAYNLGGQPGECVSFVSIVGSEPS